VCPSFCLRTRARRNNFAAPNATELKFQISPRVLCAGVKMKTKNRWRATTARTREPQFTVVRSLFLPVWNAFVIFVHPISHKIVLINKSRRQRNLLTMRFLHLIRPVMAVLPEVEAPDRKVRKDITSEGCI